AGCDQIELQDRFTPAAMLLDDVLDDLADEGKRAVGLLDGEQLHVRKILSVVDQVEALDAFTSSRCCSSAWRSSSRRRRRSCAATVRRCSSSVSGSSPATSMGR